MLRGWPRSISMSPISGGARCGGEARKIGRRWNGSCGWSRIGCRNRASSIPGQMHASPSDTRGGSRMLELGTYGSERGARGNSRPYRDHATSPVMSAQDPEQTSNDVRYPRCLRRLYNETRGKPDRIPAEFRIGGQAMESVIAKLVQDFEQGKMNRRQLIQSLSLAAAAAAGIAPAARAAGKPLEALYVN